MYQLIKPDNIVEILEKAVVKYSQRPFLGTKNKALQQYEWITFADLGKRKIKIILTTNYDVG